MLKYILLVGASHSGKSTTSREVCKKLNPSSIQRLNSKKELEDKNFTADDIANGTFVISIKNKNIL